MATPWVVLAKMVQAPEERVEMCSPENRLVFPEIATCVCFSSCCYAQNLMTLSVIVFVIVIIRICFCDLLYSVYFSEPKAMNTNELNKYCE